MNKPLCILFFLLFASQLRAQTDTLREDELPALKEGYKNSSIAHFQRVHEYSKLMDSTKAGNYLLMVDPFYLLWEWGNTNMPDSFLSKLNLATKAVSEFTGRYDSAKTAPKAESYVIFEEMAAEDREIRNRILRCADTFTCRKARERMRHTDSIHATYLYNYVMAYGWPSLANGSMPATLLAIHDHRNHNFYMPYLKKAVREEQADLNALMLINYYLKSGVSHKQMLEEIRTKSNIRIDISELLKESMPKSLPRIQKAFKEACGKTFKYYYIFEAPRNEIFTNWHDLHQDPPGRMSIMERFQKELQPYCSKMFFDTYVWHHSYIPAEKTGLYIVIVYD